MLARVFAFTILIGSSMIETKEVPRIVSLKTARLGDKVTLHCGAEKENINILWYKQSIGYVPQKVALIVGEYSEIFPPFNSSFTAAEPDMDLNIRSVSKEDEANYFCQEHYSKNWSGLFLSVKDPNDQRFVSQTVVQQPVSASAQLGDPVALQCSITSQRTDHSNQCQGEPSVYWFRSGSSQPAAIYMNGNRSGECQHSSGPPSAPQSCVYTLPKNNVDYSDAGTYYCALAACGEAMFGNGTQLKITRPNLVPATVVLGILLACCLVVIIILLLTRNKKQVCEHCKGTLDASYSVPHDSVIQEPQDGKTDSLNYAALELSGRKTRGRKKNSERTQESLYSADGKTDSLNYAALEFSGRKTRGRKKNSERTQESVYSAVRETCH
ncbi:uncharacterized protein LOC115552672 isoform X4 [Gadus morhua]|uniref:uncharacterized protein LOC115552672 isoform X4 n=1 Tax=Gadus morhua TaxID=8049 RepID=UPI0011B3C0D0|nr:uncharacterized protein LOC115552672 isoform X4 [Gadus morhua]